MSVKIDRAGSESNQAKRIRHAISTGLSFLETSVKNLAGSRPNVPQALKMYGVGSGKLKVLIEELDRMSAVDTSSTEQGYSGTKDAVYTSDNEEVQAWTKKFQVLTRDRAIFERFESESPGTSLEKARVVASHWNRFSAFMPWFLCQSAAQVSTNLKRHYVIQTAFEELGMRDSNEIHPEMFWAAAQQVGVTDQDRIRLLKSDQGKNVLEYLRTFLLNTKSDSEVLGVLLGLEIPALENIETVFGGLAHNEDARITLAAHKFFKLHRQIEVEHVRLTVSNFLRFCVTDAEKREFIGGFDAGLTFWAAFWSSVSSEIKKESERQVTRA